MQKFNQDYILRQIEEKQRKKKRTKKMSDDEYLMNRDIIKKIKEKD